MKRLGIVFLISISAPMLAAGASFPAGYWTLPMPNLEPSVRCRIQFKSENPEKILDQIDGIFSRHGGHAGQRGATSKNDPLLGQIRGLAQTFDLPSKDVDALARSLTTLATYDGYSCSSGTGSARRLLPMLNERIKILRRELFLNSKALARMPLTRLMLQQTLHGFNDVHEKIVRTTPASIEVTVLDRR